MKNQKIPQKQEKNIKIKITIEVKLELPKLHLKLINKFKGKHNLINKFIYIPDIVNGDNFDIKNAINKSTQDVNEYMTTKNIKYDLLGFSFNKSMQLKFEYLIEDEESGLCSTAWLTEDEEGWTVTKIEPYWDISQ